MSVYGLIRFDIEDFITPESDEGLAAVLAAMEAFDMPGSYGLVGKKVQSLKSHHREDLLAKLGKQPSIGFHSLSHSEHPTLSEDLADRPYEEGVERFIAREKPGVQWVTELVGPPTYFTQPGGNWVPQACDALPQLQLPIFFSDAWNSYLVTSPQPMWIEDILHLSPPVATPKPFAMNLPDNLEDAVAMIHREAQVRRSGDIFMVMVHPTELVTTKFWDAVNFSFGATNSTLRPAPLRSRTDRDQAARAFYAYIKEIHQISGIEWLDVNSLANRLVPLGAPRLLDLTTLRTSVASHGLGPVVIADESYSAADLVVATALSMTGAPLGTRLPRVRAPRDWRSEENRQSADGERMPIDAVLSGARQIVNHVEKTHRLPGTVTLGTSAVTIQDWMRTALAQFAPHTTSTVPLTFLNFVKEPNALHWDWPIFPPDFRPVGLWEDTRRLAWSLKYSQYRT
ncbi:MAG: hypothetical protein C7B44_10670 [Sulfobacillus thermosulfidooxidans]|nr:MAG: hypothetical protein C7B44_10670 [Sulfobacillus thermosulfidooxidans]